MTRDAPEWRVGIDVGGTFTDGILVSGATGESRIAKVLSTPEDPSRGFVAAMRQLMAGGGIRASAIGQLSHATTVATNAIIERKLARTALITTEGFSDMLEIARQTRPSLYDLRFSKPPPLVPRRWCIGVRERLDAKGEVVVPLDEDGVRAAARWLRAEGVESVAVCLLHSYSNSAHEHRVGELLVEEWPDVMCSLSADVVPEFREYVRATTTIINAAIRPIVDAYLERLERQIAVDGVKADLHVMQSNGGVCGSGPARQRPVFMVESGPAAGVMAASHLGRLSGHQNVVTFDMGGTTAKVGLVKDGRPHVTKDYEVGPVAGAGIGSRRGAGYPIRTPVIDLVEIGAGGGSIAWVDTGGALRVGPVSAGADPGPACYGRGGIQPTVTDANLVLGRLNPNYFLGGEIQLDVERARRAVEECCATPLGLSVEEAGLGIVEIANAAMVNALHLVSVQRGEDPRRFTLVAFGGAGPAHANRLAIEAGISTTLIPPSPGTASAFGLLTTDIKREYSASMLEKVANVDVRELEDLFLNLEGQALDDFDRDAMPEHSRLIERYAEVRYVGQSFELPVSVPEGALDVGALASITSQFHREHQRLYGYGEPNEPVELVTVRIVAVGLIPKPSARQGDVGARESNETKAVRPVLFDARTGYVACNVYERVSLGRGTQIVGPAIIEEFDSTTVVHPGYVAEVDPVATLVIRRA